MEDFRDYAIPTGNNGCYAEVMELAAEARAAREKAKQPARPVDSPYLTAREAALYLNVSYGTFRNWATKIKKQKTGRFRKEDLDNFAKTRRK
ncbi:helix-turn-helix domain-containing protein [Fimbriiglobus ruber]|uniref:Helix-turn-helix domain-containing protein n=1 Tax=Fimbriiglobus ruber TaxID=1908690 RepID=A0A225E4B5_9BACT|nr:helix-turn-helix domain-containing protein [Fimbriiglobus ruber]OWK46594.1 hypothetical protein FRUB_00293 [Fimbriiglobus ruber]